MLNEEQRLLTNALLPRVGKPTAAKIVVNNRESSSKIAYLYFCSARLPQIQHSILKYLVEGEIVVTKTEQGFLLLG